MPPKLSCLAGAPPDPEREAVREACVGVIVGEDFLEIAAVDEEEDIAEEALEEEEVGFLSADLGVASLVTLDEAFLGVGVAFFGMLP